MNILIANPIDCNAINRLRSEHSVCCAFHARREELRRLLRDTEVLVFRSAIRVTPELMDCAPRLKLLVRAGLGCDNVDLPHAHERGLEYVWVPLPTESAIVDAINKARVTAAVPA